MPINIILDFWIWFFFHFQYINIWTSVCFIPASCISTKQCFSHNWSQFSDLEISNTCFSLTCDCCLRLYHDYAIFSCWSNFLCPTLGWLFFFLLLFVIANIISSKSLRVLFKLCPFSITFFTYFFLSCLDPVSSLVLIWAMFFYFKVFFFLFWFYFFCFE